MQPPPPDSGIYRHLTDLVKQLSAALIEHIPSDTAAHTAATRLNLRSIVAFADLRTAISPDLEDEIIHIASRAINFRTVLVFDIAALVKKLETAASESRAQELEAQNPHKRKRSTNTSNELTVS